MRMKTFSPLALFIHFLLLSAAHAAPTSGNIAIIDDAELTRTLQRTLEGYAESGKGVTADELAEGLPKVPAKCDVTFKNAAASGSLDESVYLIGSVYLCGKCDKWHSSGSASAWALTTDGLMVTNYHVIDGAQGGAMGVCGIDGTVHRVTEILAADEINDIAIFRVDSKSLKPLPIGTSAAVGSKVEVVSHPEGRFFTHSFGQISRYARTPGKADAPGYIQMSITADYAKGSSGGPVLNEQGEVVGMVRSTKSIYYNNDKKSGPTNLQMVVKICIPVSAISSMLHAEPASSPGKVAKEKATH